MTNSFEIRHLTKLEKVYPKQQVLNRYYDKQYVH